ncbi:MAG: disulfide bond formation protein DsbA [Rhodobiaceae bacterium]|nr:disulfide bond formation protein DsbA [Rhodobiaceae bacterium]
MSKQNQIIVAIVAVVLVGLVAIFGVGQNTDQAEGNTDSAVENEIAQAPDPAGPAGTAAGQDDDLGALESPNPLGEIVLGQADAPVTIVEYSSLTCPHCGAFHRETLPELTKKYIDPGLVKVYFRPFPFDPYATAGAMLVHCVSPAARGSFLDILFKRQQQWIQAEQPMLALQGIAQQAGLSESDFVVCLKDQKRLDGIRNIQSRAADELGVRSTPTFFINGDKLEGNQPLAAFEKVLKPLLANARGAQ